MALNIAVGTDQGVLVHKPGDHPDATWSLVCQGQHARRVEALVQAPDGNLYVGATPGTVYRTRDGEYWQSFAEGLTYTSVHALSLHPDFPQILFAGTEPAAVFRSTDSGSTWEKLPSFNGVSGADKWSYPAPPHRAFITSLLQHPKDPKAVLATVAVGGLIASLDGGLTWTERHAGLGRETYQVAIHPAAPGRIYAATGAGVYRSDDLGGTWKEMNHGLPYHFIRGLAIDPDDPDRLMIGANQKRDGGAAVIARSLDGAATWQVTATGLPSLQGNCVTCFASAPGLFAFGTDRGLLYGSDDFGEKWRRLRVTSPPIRSMAFLRIPLG